MNLKKFFESLGDGLLQLVVPIVTVVIIGVVADTTIRYGNPHPPSAREKLCFQLRQAIGAEPLYDCPSDPLEWRRLIFSQTAGPDREAWVESQQRALGCWQTADRGCFYPQIERLKEQRLLYEADYGRWVIKNLRHLKEYWLDLILLVVVSNLPFTLFAFPFLSKRGEVAVSAELKVTIYNLSLLVPLYLLVSNLVLRGHNLWGQIHLLPMTGEAWELFRAYYWFGFLSSFAPTVQNVLGHGLGEIAHKVTPKWEWAGRWVWAFRWAPGAPFRIARSLMSAPVVWCFILPWTLLGSLQVGLPLYNNLVVLLVGSATASALMASLPSLWPLINFATIFRGSFNQAFDHAGGSLTKAD